MKKRLAILILGLGILAIPLFVAAQNPGMVPNKFGQTMADNAYERFGNAQDAAIGYNTAQTPDALFLGLSSDSRNLVIGEKADAAYDFAHAISTNPTLFIQSAAQSATQWMSLSHNGTNGVIDVGTGVVSFPDGIAAVMTPSGQMTFSAGAAVTGTAYQVGRDADATNQLHFNVPTGASFEMSVNDTAEYTFNATDADFKANNFVTTGTVGGGAATFTSVQSPTLSTAANAASETINIPVTGTDAGAHTVALNVDGNTGVSVAATGDGAGGVGVRTVQVGVSGAADVVNIGDANALVDITDAHWSITEAGILSIVSMGADWTNAGRTVADAGILTTVDINGGSIDGAAIGASSASTGKFSTVETPSIFTADNAASATVNIPVSGADAGVHTLDLQIDGNSGLSIAATGDGAGGVGVRTVNVGVSGAADVVHVGDANAKVDITDDNWSISEAGVFTGSGSGLTGVPFAGLAALPAGQILVGSAGNVATAVPLSGQATLAASGALTITSSQSYVEVPISSANIVAMNGAPVEVIAAVPGSAIEIVSAVLIYDYDTAAYTDGGDVGLIYAGGTALTGVVTAANSLGAAGDKIAYLAPVVPTNNQLLSNTAVQITNATGAFTDAGPAAGVARLQISYKLHTTGL